MPLGGRTPDSPQPHNPAPSPTDSGVCAISPSDLVGYVGNLINRVDELEQKVAELEAGNVEANQLSDLSQQVGWVGGITYMGVPGWTQTEYGTLIPPPGFSLVGSGFTMSDGNQYTGVYYDENGVLQFGFLADGSGIGGVIGSALGPMDYAVYAFGSGLATNPYTVSSGITLVSNTYSSSVASGAIVWQVSQAGLYLISCGGGWQVTGSSGSIALMTTSDIGGGSNIAMDNKGVYRSDSIEDIEAAMGINTTINDATASIGQISHNQVIALAAGDRATASMAANPFGSGSYTDLAFNKVAASIVRLGKL